MVRLALMIVLYAGIVLLFNNNSAKGDNKTDVKNKFGFSQGGYRRVDVSPSVDQEVKNINYHEQKVFQSHAEIFLQENDNREVTHDDNEEKSDYFTKSSNITLDYYHVFNEGLIDCAIVCPSGYLIGDITYGFQNGTDDELSAHFLSLLDHLNCLYHPHEPGACVKTPCLALSHCLSYQACVFKLSNELCQSDPMPGSRKILHVFVTCFRNDQILDMVQDIDMTAIEIIQLLQKQSFVSYIQTRTMGDNIGNEHGKLDYSSASVKLYEIPESDVFDGSCPSGKKKEEQYMGECSGSPPSPVEVAKEIWTKLARIPDRNHRLEFKSVYCAYHYNRQGECVPSLLASNRTGQMLFTSKMLPISWMKPEKILQDQDTPHISLVPVKLGFILMVHKGPMAVFQLIQLIFRPDHFYVIHVCRGAEDVREKLQKCIFEKFRGYNNIRVLPYSRSFHSTWGSYEIVRAEMECIEELLRMGVWDFVINLSGQDLPLRRMEDLSWALAPYRGRNFILVNFKLNYTKDEPSRSVWYNLGGHVFNVTTRMTGDFEIFSTSTWFVLSRDFASYSINPDEDKVREKLFFVQTSMIPDETYFYTILEAGRFRGTSININLHYIPSFEGSDMNNLCRHADDIDYCGMGPRVLHSADVGELKFQSLSNFFARKFSTDPQDATRKQIINNLAYSPTSRFYGLTETVVRKLADHALACLKEQHSPKSQNWTLQRVTFWTTLPKLELTDSCCEAPRLAGGLVEEYMYIILFNVENTLIGTQEARASLKLKPRHNCFSTGIIRSMQLTTRLQHQYLPHLPRREPPDSFPFVLPIPTEPAGSYFLWLHIVLQTEDLLGACAEVANVTSQTSNQTFANYWHTEELDHWDMFFLGTLFDPAGNVRCHREIRLHWTGDLKASDVFRYVFMCGAMEAGKWTVNLKQQFTTNPYVYSTSIYLANTQDYNADDIRKFWMVTDVAILPV